MRRHFPQLKFTEGTPERHAEDYRVDLSLDRLVDDSVRGISSLKQVTVDFEILSLRCHLGLREDFFPSLCLRNEISVEREGPSHLDNVDDVNFTTVAFGQITRELHRHEAGLGPINGHEQRFQGGTRVSGLNVSLVTAEHRASPCDSCLSLNQCIIIDRYSCGKRSLE
jgi:hypothetical protein